MLLFKKYTTVQCYLSSAHWLRITRIIRIIMKKFLSAALLALASSSAFGMEHTAMQVSPLYIPELRLHIAHYLFRTGSYEEALKSFRALFLTHTTALGLLRVKPDLTTSFLMQLCPLLYNRGFPMTLLDELKPLLNEKEIAPFHTTLYQCQDLRLLILECA